MPHSVAPANLTGNRPAVPVPVAQDTPALAAALLGPLSPDTALRRSGIEVVGQVPWGAHFCQFYDTSEDLVETLVPYFREGLAANEFCMWVTSAPLQVEEAAAALRKAVPDLDRRIARGQIEILDYSEWYTLAGEFSSDRVLQGWVDKLVAARQRGYEGLRLTGNTFWLEQATWDDFTRYEEAVNDVIGRYRMLAVCTYSLQKCGAMEIMDVVANHEFALIKRAGRWEIIESAHHKKTEQALRESEERLRLAVQAAQLGVFEWDVPADRAVWENDRMYAIFGRSREEGPLSKAEFMAQVLHPEDAATFEQALAAGMAPGALFRTTCRVRRKDGEWRWVEYAGRFELDHGAPRRLTGVLGDITERKRAEQALQEANERLVSQTEELNAQAEQLEMQTEDLHAANEELQTQAEALRAQEDALREADRRKDEFLAMLAHELRNPLAAVSTAVQLVRAHTPANAAQQRACDAAGRQARHMARLLDDLLDVSRITRGKITLRKETVDLASVIEDAVESVGPAIRERRHRLRVSLTDHALRLDADPVRLAQVVSNLLVNATKYTPAGGEISIEVSRCDRSGRVGERENGRMGDAAEASAPPLSHSPTPPLSHLEIRVRDNGHGIAPAMLPRIFDLFVQAEHAPDRAQGGLGIGLTMVRALVEMHGGQVEARSDGPGKGSEFVVRLPLGSAEWGVGGGGGLPPRRGGGWGGGASARPRPPPPTPHFALPTPSASWWWTTTRTPRRCWPRSWRSRDMRPWPRTAGRRPSRSSASTGPTSSCWTSASQGWMATKSPDRCAGSPDSPIRRSSPSPVTDRKRTARRRATPALPTT